MYFLRKLKPDRNINGMIPPIIIGTLFFVVLILFGLEPAIRVMGIGMAVISVFLIIGYFRTLNLGHLISALYMVSISIFVISLPADYLISHGKLPIYAQLNVFISVFLMIWLVILFFMRKIKWRGREVFELAALNVEDVSDGFTTRPLPAGKIEGSKTQILGFAEFLKRNLVAMPFVEKSKVVLVPVMMGREHRFLYGMYNDYLDKSWVSIDFQGNVSVNISKKDYLNYQENLSFDQLCEGLGQTFIDFFEMFKKGDSVRIIDKLNSL